MKKQKQQDSISSQQSNNSSWISFKKIFCPCLLPSMALSPDKTNHLSFDPIEESSNRGSIMTELRKTKKFKPDQLADRKSSKDTTLPLENSSLKETLIHKKQQYAEHSEIHHKEKRVPRRSLGNIRWDFPICGLGQKQLISIGINDRHLLIRVSQVHLSPHPSALKKQLSQSSTNKRKQNPPTTNIDRFWIQRYALFQRFDQGIKLDEQSWLRTPPGPVCQWIAGKCVQARLIVDAFAGVGGIAIRIANGPRCIKVIANDWNANRLQYLLNNSKVYDVDRCIQLSQTNFLNFQHKGIEVVFAQPPLDQQMRTPTNGCISIVDFEPTLDKIISKSLSLSDNFILLLPPGISIDVLCSCINKSASQLGKMKNSCSAKLEKIYYQGELKYVLLMVGRLVQDQIKLSHQLNFIYAKLQEPEKGPFHHKKVVKVLREQFGMVFLLNLLKECEKKFKERKNKKEDFRVFDILLEIIKQRSLMPVQKLNKILISQQQNSIDKKRSSHNQSHNQSLNQSAIKQEDGNLAPIMEEEKVNQDITEFRMSEQTQSEISHYSYFQGFDKTVGASRIPRAFNQSFESVEIKRTINNSRERRSVSPNSPGRRQKNRRSPSPIPRVSPLNRASQVPLRSKEEKQSPKLKRGSQAISQNRKIQRA